MPAFLDLGGGVERKIKGYEERRGREGMGREEMSREGERMRAMGYGVACVCSRKWLPTMASVVAR